MDDDAELLQQLAGVIYQTSECYRSLIARRDSLDACVRHAEELQTHLHGAHARAVQRIQYLEQAMQPDAASSSDSENNAVRCARRSFEACQQIHFILPAPSRLPMCPSAHVLACQCVSRAFVFACVRTLVRLLKALTHPPHMVLVPVHRTRSEQEQQTTLQVKDLLQRLQDEMMPAPPPQVGTNLSAARFVQQGELCHAPAIAASCPRCSHIDAAHLAAAAVCSSAMPSISKDAAVEDIPDGAITGGRFASWVPDGLPLLADETLAHVHSTSATINRHSQGKCCACGSETACRSESACGSESASGTCDDTAEEIVADVASSRATTSTKATSHMAKRTRYHPS